MYLPLFIQYNTLSAGLPFWMASHDIVSEPPRTKYSGHCMRQTNQTNRFQPEACWKSYQTKRRIKQTATRSIGVAYVKKGKNAKASPNGKHAARFPFWREGIKAANFGCCLCESEDSQVGMSHRLVPCTCHLIMLYYIWNNIQKHISGWFERWGVSWFDRKLYSC